MRVGRSNLSLEKESLPKKEVLKDYFLFFGVFRKECTVSYRREDNYEVENKNVRKS